MAFQFDGTGRWNFPTWTASGEFSITLRETFVDTVFVSLGNSLNTSNFVGTYHASSQNWRCRIAGTTFDLPNSDVGALPGDYVDISLTRDASNVLTFSVNGASRTQTIAGDLVLNCFSGYNTSAAFPYTGIISGTTLLTNGTSSRSYDWNQSPGTTVLPDMVSNQDATIDASFQFTSGDFVSEAPVIGTIGNRNYTVGDNVSLVISTTDDGTISTLTADVLPSGLTLDSSTPDLAILSGVVTAAETISTTFTATDNDGNTDTEVVVFTINASSITLPNSGAYVIPIMGQSNAIGRAAIDAGVDDNYSGLDDVYQFGSNNILSPVSNPLKHGGNKGENPGSMGLWLSMVRSFRAIGMFADKPIVLVPVADGATNFSQWADGQVNYLAAVQRINAAIALNAKNHIPFVYWGQGESSGDDSQSVYLSNISSMRTSMIEDISGLNTETGWVCMKVYVVANGHQDPSIINLAIQEFVSSIPRGISVDTSDLSLFDLYHFDSVSTRALGARVAAAYASIATDLSSAIHFLRDVPGQVQAIYEHLNLDNSN